MPNRLAEKWATYRDQVVPKGAGRAQLQGTELAFYGGAASMLDVLLSVLEPGREPTPGDLRVMDEIANELREHAAKAARGEV